MRRQSKQRKLTQQEELKLEDLASEQSQYWPEYIRSKDYNCSERIEEARQEEAAKERALEGLTSRIEDWELNSSDIAFAIGTIWKEDWFENMTNYN